MNRFLSLLVFSNAWVALCFSILCLGLAHHFKMNNLFTVWSFSFFGTVVSYTLHRELRMVQLKNEQVNSPRFHWMLEHRKALRSFVVISFLCSLISFLFLNWNIELFIILGLIAFITGAYTIKLPFLFGGLRGISGTKIIWISITWTLTALVPFFSNSTSFPFVVPLIIFATTFVQIIPFDIRDLVNDRPTLKTIPQLIRKENAQILVSLLIVVIALVFCDQFGFSWFIVPFVISSILGCFWPISIKNALILEFFWEIPLFFLGLMWFSIPN